MKKKTVKKRCIRFEYYRDAEGGWRWTLYATNGKKIADSSEGYKRRVDCLRAICLIGVRARSAMVFERENQAK